MHPTTKALVDYADKIDNHRLEGLFGGPAASDDLPEAIDAAAHPVQQHFLIALALIEQAKCHLKLAALANTTAVDAAKDIADASPR